jgi:hypothetical protein
MSSTIGESSATCATVGLREEEEAVREADECGPLVSEGVC